MSDLDDPKGLILASVAVGFVRGRQGDNQPTHYKLLDVYGPLQVRWPNGQWYEVSVKEIEQEEENGSRKSKQIGD